MIRVLISVLLLLPGLAFAQTGEKPKLKDFGSSLKKLKWDPQKNATAEVTHSSSDDDEVIKIETTLVSSELLVLDKQGQPVQGLKESDFQITEEGVPQEVGHFLLGDNRDLARSIVLIIDYSYSQFAYIKKSVEAAGVLVDKLGPYDQMAIVTDDVEVLVDFTNNKRELKKKLNTLIEKSRGDKSFPFLGIGKTRRRFGKSAQYSALMATLREAFDKEAQRSIVIFQTDGDEAETLRNPIVVPTLPPDLPPEAVARTQELVEYRRQLQRSGMTEFSLEDVYRAVEQSRATIYTVVPGVKLSGLTPDQQFDALTAENVRTYKELLSSVDQKTREGMEKRREEIRRVTPIQYLRLRSEELARVQEALVAVAPLSGGWTEFLERPEQAQGIYTRILSDISQRYIVGYYPTNKERDGNRRRITFEVKGHPEYTILGRRSYFAPGSE